MCIYFGVGDMVKAKINWYTTSAKIFQKDIVLERFHRYLKGIGLRNAESLMRPLVIARSSSMKFSSIAGIISFLSLRLSEQPYYLFTCCFSVYIA